MRSKPEALCIVSGIRLSPIISASVSGSIGGYHISRGVAVFTDKGFNPLSTIHPAIWFWCHESDPMATKGFNLPA